MANVDEVVLDSQGNIYVVGFFDDTLYYDPSSSSVKLFATQAGKPTVYFAKYTPAGALVMAKAVGTGYGLDIALDKWNNIYITGYSPAATNSDFDPGPGTAYHTSGTQFMFMCKYDNNGNYLNSLFFSGNGVKGLGIAVDSLSNIYLSGCVQVGVDFDPGPGTLLLMRHTTSVNRDGFYASYDSSMNLRWAKVDILTRDCEDIAVENTTGRILVASMAPRLVNQSGATTDSLITSVGGTHGVAFDDVGSMYFSGDFSGSNVNFNWNGSNTLSTTGPNDDWGFLVKYNSSRVFQWAQKYKVNYDVQYSKVSVLSNTVLLAYFESDGVVPHRGFLKVNPANGSTIASPCDFATHVGTQSVSSALYSSSDNSLIFTGNAGSGNYVYTFDINPDTSVAALQNESALGYWGFAIKYANCTTPPAQPGNITGTTALCNTANQTYTIAPISGATSYIWTLPNGWTGTSTSNSITVQPAANGGNISVAAQNFCGSSSATSLAVTYTPQVSVAINASAGSICAGSAVTLTATGAANYSWSNGVTNGTPFTPITSATYTVTASTGSCIAIDSITVVVKQPTAQAVSAAICNGQSYLFNGTLLTAAGTYYDTLVNNAGCDSIITLTLSVKQPTASASAVSICQGQSYFFNGQNLSVAGVYKDTVVNSVGCDSIITLTLIVNTPTSASVSAAICQGQVYFFNGQNLSAAGTYKDTLVNNAGCDSIITLTLAVKQNTSSAISAAICPGQSYFFGGSAYTTAGLYYDTLTNAAGCDSVITLSLSLLQASTSNITASVCQGQTYSFNGVSLTAAGFYKDTLINSIGCDSVVWLTLTVVPNSSYTFSQVICQGESYLFNGVYITTAGSYADTLANAAGCDSLVTLLLTVAPVQQTLQQATICSGSVYNFGGQQLAVAGTYTDTLQTLNGCDSVVTLTLLVDSFLYTTIDDTICYGEVYIFNQTDITEAGVYYDTIQTGNICDNILVLHLVVNPLPQPTITRSNDTLFTQYFADYSWTLNGLPVGGNENYLKVNANGNYSVLVTDANGCSDTSALFNVTALSVGLLPDDTEFVRLYPNPNTGFFTVEFTGEMVRGFTVTNAMGQVVISLATASQRFTFNLNNATSGIYFLHVEVAGHKKVYRFNIVK